MFYDVPTERNAMASKPKMWRAALRHSVCDSNQHDDDARGIRAHAGNWGRAEVGIPTWRKLAARFPNVPTIRERLKAGPDWKTSRHDMAVWLPANIDDEDPCAVLAHAPFFISTWRFRGHAADSSPQWRAASRLLGRLARARRCGQAHSELARRRQRHGGCSGI
jgi:hypothetical protein